MINNLNTKNPDKFSSQNKIDVYIKFMKKIYS